MKNLLKEMQEYARINHVPIIKEQAADVLCGIAVGAGPRHILEIGTAIGYSALLLAASSGGDAELITLEMDAVRIRTAEAFIARSPYKENIRIIEGDAAETLEELREKQAEFDFVFIDAAKGQYLKYWRAVLPMLAAGGIVAADNVLFRGYVESAEKPPRRYKTIVGRLRAYLEEAGSNAQFSTQIYYEGDGLAVSRRRA